MAGYSRRSELLFQRLGVEPPVNLVLVGGVTICLKRCNHGAQPRREDDQIPGIFSGCVSVGDTRRHKHRCSGADGFRSVRVSKSQFAIQNVPSFVVGTVDVKRGGAAAAPLMYAKRCAGS
jgi:hypothetical protein